MVYTSPTKIVTRPNICWSYVNAWEPKSINEDTPRFSSSLIIPKFDAKTVEKVKAAYEESQSKLKNNSKSLPRLKAFKVSLRDGHVRRLDNPTYMSSCFVNANNSTTPSVVDTERNPVIARSTVYPDVYGLTTINFYASPHDRQKEITCGQGNQQLVRANHSVRRYLRSRASRPLTMTTVY